MTVDGPSSAGAPPAGRRRRPRPPAVLSRSAFALLLTGVAAAPPAAAQSMDLKCPCRVEGDGGSQGTLTVTFGARNFANKTSRRVVVTVEGEDRYGKRWELARIRTEHHLEPLATLAPATYETSNFWSSSYPDHLQLFLSIHPRHDHVAMAGGEVDMLGPYEVEGIDFLADTDGDGVGDVNEGIAGTDPEDPDSTPGDSTLDVLVYYTQEFLDRYDGEPAARIRHYLSVANTTMRDSDVALRFRLVGMVLISPGIEWRGTDQPTTEAMERENARHGADMPLIYNTRDPVEFGTCASALAGRWRGHGFLGADFLLLMAVVSDDDRCPSRATAHELGHTLGLAHSYAQKERGFAFRWSRGYRIDGDFHTLMAYRSPSGSHPLDVLSSPDATCRGDANTARPCGVDRDQADGADARTTLDVTRFQVAALAEGFPDRDGDGVVDPMDGFPDDPDEWRDADRDGIADAADDDDDGDGVADEDDPFPLDGDEWADTDGDGDGDNGDPDDDGDVVADTVDLLPHHVTRAERMVLLMPPASDARREGFVRVANLSPEAGEVRIGAGDADGRRGEFTLAIGAAETRHFNSTDLEEGNPDKGLSGGVGAGRGDWRLELSSELDIEVAAYVRTADGFLTAMHDVAPAVANRHRVPFFNPGSNAAQVSLLRIFNPTAGVAGVAIAGVDDDGRSPGGGVTARVPPGAVRSFTAAEFEAGGDGFDGSLGDGRGKWRLTVESDRRIAVMNLLESPTGHLTNLSTASPHRFDAVQTVPLFPAADPSGPQGFARVFNRSAEAGEVRIAAFDDAGAEHGPVTLALDAGETAHFNSADLERGNAAKGLSGGVGAGAGDWRLEFAAELDIEVLAYLRTPEGFVTAMHDAAPAVDDRHWVSVFNPGSNRNQVSRLRLVNRGTEPAEVDIRGVDDGGASPGDAVRTAVPAGAARTFTAAQLEAGADGLEGALGDGAGKWRLMVESRQPLVVMGLLKSPTGHLTNLSTPGPGTASRTFTDELAGGGKGPEMVAIPRGAFRMGCRHENVRRCAFYNQWPSREVAMTHRFALSTHEVSFADWDACAAAGACRHAGDRGWGRGDRPVIDVNWDDAREYAAWLSEATGEAYRLPSEAEWEYAARAGIDDRLQLGQRQGLEARQLPEQRQRVGSDEYGAGGVVHAQPVGAPRHARQRRGVGGGLLEHGLPGRPHRRHGLDRGRLRLPRRAWRSLVHRLRLRHQRQTARVVEGSTRRHPRLPRRPRCDHRGAVRRRRVVRPTASTRPDNGDAPGSTPELLGDTDEKDPTRTRPGTVGSRQGRCGAPRAARGPAARRRSGNGARARPVRQPRLLPVSVQCAGRRHDHDGHLRRAQLSRFGQRGHQRTGVHRPRSVGRHVGYRTVPGGGRDAGDGVVRWAHAPATGRTAASGTACRRAQRHRGHGRQGRPLRGLRGRGLRLPDRCRRRRGGRCQRAARGNRPGGSGVDARRIGPGPGRVLHRGFRRPLRRRPQGPHPPLLVPRQHRAARQRRGHGVPPRGHGADSGSRSRSARHDPTGEPQARGGSFPHSRGHGFAGIRQLRIRCGVDLGVRPRLCPPRVPVRHDAGRRQLQRRGGLARIGTRPGARPLPPAERDRVFLPLGPRARRRARLLHADVLRLERRDGAREILESRRELPGPVRDRPALRRGRGREGGRRLPRRSRSGALPGRPPPGGLR